ncbi:MAG: rhomboid family intramembrane serine protease [Theionarchaea archaeon]|nr:rhomboid family intramembrane serine protease [Theionarchaea archaeon]
MLPVRDFRPTRIFPVVTYTIIGINVIIFIGELLLDGMGYLDWFYYEFAVIPAQVMEGEQLYSLFTSMFMHSGVFHILFNMLYLYIFGNNIEDSMGSRRFLIFYILCGLIATGAHIYTDPESQIPTLGASGAIAGVLGAYMVLYPRERVDALLGYFYIRVPAIVVLLTWFILQLFSGILSLGHMGEGGIAFFAHIGGFIAGAILIFIFRKRQRDQ